MTNANSAAREASWTCFQFCNASAMAASRWSFSFSRNVASSIAHP